MIYILPSTEARASSSIPSRCQSDEHDVAIDLGFANLEVHNYAGKNRNGWDATLNA